MRAFWRGADLTCKARGNLQKAKLLVEKVREKAAYLFENLLPKQDYSIGKWQFPDGSRIQVQVMRTWRGERVFARIWAPSYLGRGEYPEYYLESSFMVPSIETYTTFTTSDDKLALNISPEALFIHNDRVESWSNRSVEEVGFINKPTGTELIARTQPLCLGFDEPKEELTYYQARRRWYKTYNHFNGYDIWPLNVMFGRGPGTSTGKMVLYQRAKLGRKVTLWIDDNNIFDDYVINTQAATHTCTGLLTDKYGDYWKVKIEDSATATFTKLSIDPVLRTARDRADTPQARLFIEGFILGYSTLMDGQGDRLKEIYTVNINNAPEVSEGDYADWNPVAYSWHFNWKGTKAVMVVHRGVSSYETRLSRVDNIQTEVWELDIDMVKSAGIYTPSVTFSKGDRYTWKRITEVSSDIIYIPSLLPGSGKIMSIWSSFGEETPVTYDQPTDVPIYAWYGTSEPTDPDNNIIYQVNYTRDRTEIEEVITGNYSIPLFVVHGATVKTGSGTRTAGVTQTISYTLLADGEVVKKLDHHSEGAVSIKTVAISEENEYSNSDLIGGSSISYADNSGGTTVIYSAVPTPPDNYVTASKTTYLWQPVVAYNLISYSGTPASITVTIPHDCAEGVLLAKNMVQGKITTDKTYTDSPVPSIKYIKISDVKAFPSGNVLGPTALEGRGHADFSIASTVVNEYTYELECFLIGRNKAIQYTEVASGTDGTYPSVSDPKGCIEAVVYAGYDEDDPVRKPLSIFEAFGGELMVRGWEDHFLNDFPEGFDFSLVQYPPVIVGSI